MTTVYDNSSNCIKLNELGECSLYYSHTTQTYVITNKTTQHVMFSHLHKFTVYHQGENVGGYYSNRLNVILELDISHKNIPSKFYILYTSTPDKNKLHEFYKTGIIDTLSNIIINGNPRRPEVDLLNNNKT